MPPAEIISHLTEHGCRDLTDDLDPSSINTQPVSHGGYGFVYCEKLRDGRQVAVKALRVPLDDDDEAGRLPKSDPDGITMDEERKSTILSQ
ncbi:hypothetical protein FRC09_003827 [Ceratobasidium sp. 395]|nr:hypothetical protein FRC09_003827 [Ceratobasidium sp. 395]